MNALLIVTQSNDTKLKTRYLRAGRDADKEVLEVPHVIRR